MIRILIYFFLLEPFITFTVNSALSVQPRNGWINKSKWYVMMMLTLPKSKHRRIHFIRKYSFLFCFLWWLLLPKETPWRWDNGLYVCAYHWHIGIQLFWSLFPMISISSSAYYITKLKTYIITYIHNYTYMHLWKL